MDCTLPVSIAVFFVGLICALRFGLPRYQALKELKSDVSNHRVELDVLGSLKGDLEDAKTRLEVAEKNITTLNGNLVTLRDATQLRGAFGK